MFHSCLISIQRQFGDHICDSAGNQAARGQVAEPHDQPDGRHDQTDHDQRPEGGDTVQQIHTIRDDNRHHRPGTGNRQGEQRYPKQAMPLRFKIIHDAAEQLAVGVSAIIFFCVKPVKKAHKFS